MTNMLPGRTVNVRRAAARVQCQTTSTPSCEPGRPRAVRWGSIAPTEGLDSPLTEATYARDASAYDRAAGFFDAVYGFALTLLVTTVDMSEPSSWDSVGALLDTNGSQLVSFGISFVVIAVFWRQNHQMLAGFRAIDGVIIVANIVVMAFVVFIPFTTEAMGDPALQDLPLPIALYALNIALAVVASAVMFQIAAQRGLLEQELSWRARRALLLDALVTPAVFLASIPVTYWAATTWDDPSLGRWCWLSLVVLAPLTGRWSARIVETDTARAT